MRKLPITLTAAFAAILAGCSSAASSSSSPAAASPPAPASATAVAKTLSPLVLGHFPSTAGGELAKAICTKWAGLRQEYVDRAAADTAYQMNRWFSGSQWTTVQDDSAQLGDDPAFGNLETALGVGLVGDAAGTSSAAAIDKACARAD